MSFLPQLLPEIFVAVAAMIMLLWAAHRGEEASPAPLWAGSVLALALGGVLSALAPDGAAFDGAFIVDGFARFSKVMLIVASVLALGSAPLFWRQARRPGGEFAVLTMLSVVGMMIMVSARDLIVLYAGLELHSLALYVLAAYRREDRRATEAGLKYFILGAVSSAILLFGLSLVYGFAGDTGFEAIGQKLAVVPAGPLSVGLVFVLAGFAFKISAVPFHMWTPDVYEGAPTPVSGLLATAPKVAALALLTRFLAGPLASVSDLWIPIIAVFAVLSMVLGSFAGLGQTNVKRLMGYSAIAHVGIMLVALLVLNVPAAAGDGVASVLLYLALYMLSALGVFACLLCLRRDGEPVEAIEDLAGLFKTHPVLTLAMGANLFSLAGIPPLAGFFGKYFVFLAAVKGGQIGLTVLGVVVSVVAAAYYLRIVKVMTFDTAPETPLDSVSDRSLGAVVALTALAVSLFMIMPSPLLNAASRAAVSLIAP